MPSHSTFSNDSQSRDARPSNKAVVALPNALFTYKVQRVEDGEDLPLHQSLSRSRSLLAFAPRTSCSTEILGSLETTESSHEQCARFKERRTSADEGQCTRLTKPYSLVETCRSNFHEIPHLKSCFVASFQVCDTVLVCAWPAWGRAKTHNDLTAAFCEGI